MKSSVTMQAYAQMPPGALQLHAPQQVSSRRVPSTAAQVQYYAAEPMMSNQPNQRSHGFWNSKSSSQPVSSSSSLQSAQMPQAWFNDLQNRVLPRNSASMRATSTVGQFAILSAAQPGTPTQNLNHHPQTLNRNSVPQQNYNMPPLQNVSSSSSVSWSPSVNSNTGSDTEQAHLMYRSVLAQYQSLNGHHNRMQITHQPAAQPQQTDLSVQINHTQQKFQNNPALMRGGNGNGALCSSLHDFTATSQRLIGPPQPSNCNHQTGQSHSSYNLNLVQHSSQIQHQPSQYRTETDSASHSRLNHSGNKQQSLSKPPHPPSYTSQHFVIQSQPNQMINQSSTLSLPQVNVQPQTPLQHGNITLVSGHDSKTYHPTVPGNQGNTQPQNLQLNRSFNGQVTIPSSTPTNEAPPPVSRESTFNYSQKILMHLLRKDSAQVPDQRHETSPLDCPKASFTTQEQIPSHIFTKANYSQTQHSAIHCSAPAPLQSKEPHRVSEYKTSVQRTAILKENEDVLGNQLKAPEVQNFEGMQTRRLQTDSNTKRIDGHQSNNRQGEVQYIKNVLEFLELAMQKVIRQSNKVVAVVPPISQQAPSQEMKEHGTTRSADSPPLKINAVRNLVNESKHVDQESNVQSLPKEAIEEHGRDSSVPHPEKQKSNKQEDGATVDSLIPDNPQSETDSNTAQGLVCSTDLPTKSPDDPKNVQTDQSNDDTFDLSKVQVHNFTLEKFINWVKILESSPRGRVKEPVADVKKCILDRYWDGNKDNIVKQIYELHTELTRLYFEVSAKEMKAAVFQYLKPKDLTLLAHGYHILNDDTIMPAEEFRSSWLNIDEQPADIENVLAEPILDLNLTDSASYRGFDTLDIYSETDHSTKVIPAGPACQSDEMINKDLANSRVGEGKFTDEVSNTQEESKKEANENIEKHPQQNADLNHEESVDSNKATDTLMESRRKTECEQVYRDAHEGIASSVEVTEERELSNDLHSNNDSQLFSLSLLSADVARTIFNEYSGCDLQKEPSLLSQDDTKVSDNVSSDFCNSANQIKFTCPHVTEVGWVGEHFCSSCWEETPLLDLDLEEAVVSPEGGGPDVKSPPGQGHNNQSRSLQSGKPDSNCSVLSERSSIAHLPTPNVDVCDVTISEPDPRPRDVVESCNSSGEEPHTPNIQTVFTLPVEKQVRETNVSMEPKIPKALTCTQKTENFLIPGQTKTPREEVSPPKSPPCKKLKLAKTSEGPAERDTSTADIVTKKATSTKPHPSDLSVTPAEDVQNCKDERKQQGEDRKAPVSPQIQINAPCSQSGKPDPNLSACSKSSSSSPNPSTYGVNTSVAEPGPNLGDSIQSCSSPSGKLPAKEPHRPVCSENVKVTMPVEKDISEADGFSGAKLPKARSITQNTEKSKPVIQSQTSIEKVSPPRYPPCKKLTVRKTISVPADDDLFTPDIVVKKASSPKPHPSDLTVALNERGRHCNEWKEAHGKWKKPSVMSQVPNVTPQTKRPAAVVNVDPNKEKVLGKTKRIKKDKGMKKMRFELYGAHNSHVQHQCHRSYMAPSYITVSNRPEPASNYTDAPSAKQKVYSQWSSTFVETKKKKHKKHQKHVKEQLKSRTQAKDFFTRKGL